MTVEKIQARHKCRHCGAVGMPGWVPCECCSPRRCSTCGEYHFIQDEETGVIGWADCIDFDRLVWADTGEPCTKEQFWDLIRGRVE